MRFPWFDHHIICNAFQQIHVMFFFHDEEWGVPLHDDKEVFMDFDPVLISKLNEKKIIAPGSTASTLLSKPKLRAIIENASKVLKNPPSYGLFLMVSSFVLSPVFVGPHGGILNRVYCRGNEQHLKGHCREKAPHYLYALP